MSPASCAAGPPYPGYQRGTGVGLSDIAQCEYLVKRLHSGCRRLSRAPRASCRRILPRLLVSRRVPPAPGRGFVPIVLHYPNLRKSPASLEEQLNGGTVKR